MPLRNKIRINDSNVTFAEITDCTFSIEKTFVGYRFGFHFTVSSFKNENPNPIILQRLDIDLFYQDSQSSHLLGRMIDGLTENSRELNGREFSITKYFDIKTDDFLRLINESHRTDMTFEFQVNPVFLNSPHHSRSETGQLKISHSDWLRQINNTKLDRFELITIRIPVATSHLHTPFVEALKKIREAEQQYIRGDWNGAAASCRAAWNTVLSSAPSGAKPIDHLLAPVTGDLRRKEFAMELIRGFHNIQNKAVHLEGDVKTGTPAADMSPEDALLCIHWYTAIIGYLSSIQ
jgi:hypothetical protein